MKQKSFLLVNPPVYDFSAFDLWGKPLGLLHIAFIIKETGARAGFLDCMDRLNAQVLSLKSNKRGCGHYYSNEVDKPNVLKSVPRRYKRFGMPVETI